MADREKQNYRREKRTKKRAGVRERRRALKEQLAASPEDCSQWDDDFDFRSNTTRAMNGRFKDPKRHGHDDLEETDDTEE